MAKKKTPKQFERQLFCLNQHVNKKKVNESPLKELQHGTNPIALAQFVGQQH